MNRLASFVTTIGLAIVEAGLLLTAAVLLRDTISARASSQSLTQEISPSTRKNETVQPQLPALLPSYEGIPRILQLKTSMPERPSYKIVEYTVQGGDSAWSIAQKFDLQPETILWGNEGLSASAGSLKTGATLKILPVDGVLHTAQEGDTLEHLETMHGTPTQEIYEYPGNEFDLTLPPVLIPGLEIIVPNGRNPLVWESPGPVVVAGQGRKSPGYYAGPLANIGTGYFTWPVNAYTFTQEFWGGHPGIDLATDFRQPVFASDSGTVIFSGWDTTGYGNLVIIDHGNGYWMYYGHNAANLASSGHGVVQGQQIAESGSTGNSTGNHLDFRIRVDGGVFLNPMDFLP
jgi:murein DD-endopeptidase MepM/ murein hydrolase activator NlpD